MSSQTPWEVDLTSFLVSGMLKRAIRFFISLRRRYLLLVVTRFLRFLSSILFNLEDNLAACADLVLSQAHPFCCTDWPVIIR